MTEFSLADLSQEVPADRGMSLSNLGRRAWDVLQGPWRPPVVEDRTPKHRPVRQTPIDALVQNIAYRIMTLPQRVIESGRSNPETGLYDFDPGTMLEAAATPIAGAMPFAARGALGASGGRPSSLPMDTASRMRRADELGYDRAAYYRGEASGSVPQKFPKGGHFSRDRDYSAGFAQRGGRSEPEEYRLNMQNAFRDHAPVTAADYARLVAAARVDNPKLAADMVDQIAPGRGIDWFMGFANHLPQTTVAGNGALVRQVIEVNARQPLDVFRRAGFDAIDSGRDVLKLGPRGIRSKDAAFDPAMAGSNNIMHSLGSLGLLGAGGGLASINHPSQD